jgi:hypothetical protein
MAQIIRDPEGIASGFGYEECNKILVHDASQFDENGLCKNDRLREFIRKNIYLQPNVLDYHRIPYEYIG